MSMRARLWITAMVLLGAACFAAADGPMLSVPMATAPVIDGAIGDGEWSGASSPGSLLSGSLETTRRCTWPQAFPCRPGRSPLPQ